MRRPFVCDATRWPSTVMGLNRQRSTATLVASPTAESGASSRVAELGTPRSSYVRTTTARPSCPAAMDDAGYSGKGAVIANVRRTVEEMTMCFPSSAANRADALEEIKTTKDAAMNLM